MTDLTEFFGDPIHVYTRAQALDDGTLVDGGPEIQKMVREAGFTWPVAFTVEAWADAVAWDEANGSHQDIKGRLWDVLMVLRHTIRQAPTATLTGPLPFYVYRVPNLPRHHRAVTCRLVAHAGPGDNAEPVMTISLPDQD